MKSWKLLVAFVSALAFAVPTHAELSSLAAQFSKAGVYSVGDVVGVTATSNGVVAQYRFQVDQVFGAGYIPAGISAWQTAATFQVSTATVAIPLISTAIGPGQYRLVVSAREAALPKETLVKTRYFTVAPPGITVCDLIKGKLLVNAAAVAPPVFNAGCPGFLCMGLTSSLLNGFVKTLTANANNLVSVTLGTSSVSIVAKPQTITSALGGGTLTMGGALTGSYTCSGNTVTVNASGSSSLQGSSGLVSLLSGMSIPVSVSGTLTVDSNGSIVSVGSVVFK